MENALMKLIAFLLAVFAFASLAPAEAVVTKVQKTDGGYQLLRDGQPFFIQGAGGDAPKDLLKQYGGNSFRTWGVDHAEQQLAEAERLGLTVTLGIWLGHERHGFNYNDPEQVQKQFEAARAAVLKYKDSPALLIWAVGNEMEGYGKGDSAAIWSAVQNIAAMIHKLDPKQPTMTVIAEIGGSRIKSINAFCPDIDIVGINTYGGGPSVAQRYREGGGVKPYIITEFGPAGTWEVKKNAWDVPIEPTSTAKAHAYRATYEKSILAEKGKLCLGSYAFAWGNKQEATATWYGLFLDDGSRLEALDTLSELWSGRKPANRCPQIASLKVLGDDQVDPGATVRVKLDVADPEKDPLKITWKLTKDLEQYQAGGDAQAAPPEYPEAIVKQGETQVELKMPTGGGGYWLYAIVHDNHGGAAVADVPLRVNGPEEKPKANAPAAKLPLVLYADDMHGLPYVWSGWMGTLDAIGMDEKCTIQPHTGATCMKCEFRAKEGFGGIVWQSPANDWGEAPGGFNLSGAKKLTFWARGENGGEKVEFQFGVLGKDKKFPDSDHGSLNVTLGKQWKQYEFDLAGKNLSDIKTGFCWVVKGTDGPTAFYLDDVRYE
jgi:hypothetical protein